MNTNAYTGLISRATIEGVIAELEEASKANFHDAATMESLRDKGVYTGAAIAYEIASSKLRAAIEEDGEKRNFTAGVIFPDN